MDREIDFRLVRSATANFRAFQGLHSVVYGTCLALWIWICTLPSGDSLDVLVQAAGMLVPITLGCWAGHALPKYYRRLGTVDGGPAAAAAVIVFIWVVFWAVPVRGAFSALWVGWALFPFHWIVVAWPYRTHHVITLGVAVFLATQRLASPVGPAETQLIVRGGYLLAGALIVTGFADHFVLMRALPGAFRLKAETTDND